MEPNTFFSEIKSSVQHTDMNFIANATQILAETARRAQVLGQTTLLHKTAYAYSIMEREVKLYDMGFTRWVDRIMLQKFIDTVEPRGSVKASMLNAYPRVIPHENAEVIAKVQEMEIFDNIIVVYTDFAGETAITPEKKAQIERNKDPIAFGVFFNDELALRHDRLYMLTDWEDEFCDLTFTKLIDKMSEMKDVNANYHGKFAPMNPAQIQEVLNSIQVTEKIR